MDLPKHLFVGSDGDLYDTRVGHWSAKEPLRKDYRYTHRSIETVAQLKATLRAGEFAWPGGYQLYFLTDDGATLSFDGARSSLECCYDAIKTKSNNGWRIVGCDVNYEDDEMTCAHTGAKIPASYGSPDEPDELIELREHLKYPQVQDADQGA